MGRRWRWGGAASRWAPLLLVLLWAAPSRGQGEDAAALLAVLRQPGSVGMMRHARAPGTGDPAGFRLGDCATQRNLDAAGRAQAEAIGLRLREAGVRAGVWSSEWCRTTETAALLGLGPVTPLPVLNSFFEERGEGPGRTAALRRLAGTDAAGTRIFVTHQVNITALTGIVPADGEMVVLRPGGDGWVVAGRLRP